MQIAASSLLLPTSIRHRDHQTRRYQSCANTTTDYPHNTYRLFRTDEHKYLRFLVAYEQRDVFVFISAFNNIDNYY